MFGRTCTLSVRIIIWERTWHSFAHSCWKMEIAERAAAVCSVQRAHKEFTHSGRIQTAINYPIRCAFACHGVWEFLDFSGIQFRRTDKGGSAASNKRWKIENHRLRIDVEIGRARRFICVRHWIRTVEMLDENEIRLTASFSFSAGGECIWLCPFEMFPIALHSMLSSPRHSDSNNWWFRNNEKLK